MFTTHLRRANEIVTPALKNAPTKLRTNYLHLVCHTNYLHLVYHTNYLHLVCHTAYLHLVCHTNYLHVVCHTNYVHLACHSNYLHLVCDPIYLHFVLLAFSVPYYLHLVCRTTYLHVVCRTTYLHLACRTMFEGNVVGTISPNYIRSFCIIFGIQHLVQQPIFGVYRLLTFFPRAQLFFMWRFYHVLVVGFGKKKVILCFLLAKRKRGSSREPGAVRNVLQSMRRAGVSTRLLVNS